MWDPGIEDVRANTGESQIQSSLWLAVMYQRQFLLSFGTCTTVMQDDNVRGNWVKCWGISVLFCQLLRKSKIISK